MSATAISEVYVNWTRRRTSACSAGCGVQMCIRRAAEISRRI